MDHKELDLAFFWSAVAFMYGFVIMIAGAILRNNYHRSYTSGLRAHIAPGLIIVIGVVIAVLGLLGMILPILRRPH